MPQSAGVSAIFGSKVPTLLHFGASDAPKCWSVSDFFSKVPTLLHFGASDATLKIILPERNYRFGVMSGEVETPNCRRNPANKKQIPARRRAGTESPPAGQTPTTRARFPDDARSARQQTPSNNLLLEKVRWGQARWGQRFFEKIAKKYQ